MLVPKRDMFFFYWPEQGFGRIQPVHIGNEPGWLECRGHGQNLTCKKKHILFISLQKSNRKTPMVPTWGSLELKQSWWPGATNWREAWKYIRILNDMCISPNKQLMSWHRHDLSKLTSHWHGRRVWNSYYCLLLNFPLTYYGVFPSSALLFIHSNNHQIRIHNYPIPAYPAITFPQINYYKIFCLIKHTPTARLSASKAKFHREH